MKPLTVFLVGKYHSYAEHKTACGIVFPEVMPCFAYSRSDVTCQECLSAGKPIEAKPGDIFNQPAEMPIKKESEV